MRAEQYHLRGDLTTIVRMVGQTPLSAQSGESSRPLQLRDAALPGIGRLPVLILLANLMDVQVHAEKTRFPRIAGFAGLRSPSFVAALLIGD